MSCHAQLAKLTKAATTEKTGAREAQLAAQEAQAAAAAAREALVEAHAVGKGVAQAEKALDKARDEAEGLAIRAEARTRRHERAVAEAQAFEREHARELIEELQPQAQAAVERLTESAGTLHQAHTEWHAVSARVGELLRLVPEANGTNNAPSDHALAGVARDLRNWLRQDGEVASPLPHWSGALARQAEEQTKRTMRREQEQARGLSA